MASNSSTVVKMNRDTVQELVRLFLSPSLTDNKSDLMELANQLEQAHWHYLDLLRPEDPSLPACSFKEFVSTILHYCPHLTKADPLSLADQWKVYKHSRPVRGAILLNDNMNKCVLVQGYPASTSWGFPKGKKETNETDLEAAVREVYEEVGLDIKDVIKPEQYLQVKHKDIDSRMYIITNVSEETVFEPVARKEIRRIQWFHLKELPSHKNDETSKNHLKLSANKFYVVIPYVGPLRQWIHKHKKNVHTSKHNSSLLSASSTPSSRHTPLLSVSSAPPKPLSSTPHSKRVTSPLLYSSPYSLNHTPSSTNHTPSRSLYSLLSTTPTISPAHSSSINYYTSPRTTGSFNVPVMFDSAHQPHPPLLYARPLQRFFSPERDRSSTPPTAVKNLFNVKVIEPAVSLINFKFDTEQLLKTFNSK